MIVAQNEPLVYQHNGNILLIVWEIKTAEEIIAAGRSRESVDGPWLVDSVIEIRPTGRTTGEVVWEWHVWDHLIQDRDPSKPNRGDVASHPELIDLNFGQTLLSEVSRARTVPDEEARRKTQLKTLGSIGYLGTPAAHGNAAVMADWVHINALSYDHDRDRIMLTVRALQRVLDHRPQYYLGRGQGSHGRSERNGWRSSLPLGESSGLSSRHDAGSTTLRPAWRTWIPRPSWRGTRPGVQQRCQPARKRVFVR